MSNAIERLKLQMEHAQRRHLEFAAARSNATKLSNTLASVITSSANTYSPGETVIALANMLGTLAASVQPDHLTSEEWYDAIEGLFKVSYLISLKKRRE